MQKGGTNKKLKIEFSNEYCECHYTKCLDKILHVCDQKRHSY